VSEVTNETMQELLAELRKISTAEAEYGPNKSKDEAKKATVDGLVNESRAKDKGKAKAQGEEKSALEELISERIKAELHNTRMPAKALGNPAIPDNGGGRLKSRGGDIHPFMKANFRKYIPGELVTAMLDYKSGEPDLVARGKATLSALATWEGVPSTAGGAIGKATLGATGATGGYVLPNNLVDDVMKPNVQEFFYPSLITVINGVNVRGVDQPYRTGIPDRATVINWGALKTNVDEVYGSYTATLGTFAKIYDIGKQYLRFSAGAAEQDVLDELAKSFMRAERYAIIAGPGTGAATPGVNDPTLGVYTALAADDPTYTTTVSSAASTILGSAAKGFTQMMGTMASRSRVPTAIVCDPVSYFAIASQGTDAAGFFIDPAGGPYNLRIDSNGQLRAWGIPIYWDAAFDTNTGTTKRCIMGDWKTLKMYRGMEFRIDTSDIAGTRWDYNLVGFRGEEEIGVNAHTAVAVGAFQLGVAIIP
jgi:HK97 family phage major capsid protein